MTNLLDKIFPHKVLAKVNTLTRNEEIKTREFTRRFMSKRNAINYLNRGVENKKFRRYNIQGKTYYAKPYLGVLFNEQSD